MFCRLALFFVLLAPSFGFGESTVLWNSKEGKARLQRSTAKADFYRLVNYFEPQKNRISCGLATGAILLNAFRLGNAELPSDSSAFDAAAYQANLPEGFNPYFARYTQENFFSPSVEAVKTKAQVYGSKINGVADFGLQLRQFEQALKAHQLRVHIQVVDATVKDEAVRKALAANMAREEDFAVVNFARGVLKQAGGGHLSPLGAYDQGSDSFLVLDTNPNTSAWFWVSTKDLVAAMRTKDTVENRGYLEVSDTVAAPKK
jgi:hypothetical protein